MKRILVAGGLGYFGSVAMRLLREDGLRPFAASRSARADIRLDVEDRRSLASVLRTGDIVLDAVGPFQRRTTTLVEAAIEVGCDVVDIADSLAYVRSVYALEEKVKQAGIRVRTACSSVSAISAAALTLCQIKEPTQLTLFLLPATKWTSARGTAESLLDSIGRPIESLSNGRRTASIGWRTRRSFELPGETRLRTGYAFETADVFTLPRAFPSLTTVESFASTNVLGLNAVFRLAARSRVARKLCKRCVGFGLPLARFLGRRRSALHYEITGASGEMIRVTFHSPDQGYTIAVIPAVVAVRSLAEVDSHDGRPLSSKQRIKPLVDLFASNAIELTINRKQ